MYDNRDEKAYQAWRSRQIRRLHRRNLLSFAISLFALAFAFWVNYRG